MPLLSDVSARDAVKLPVVIVLTAPAMFATLLASIAVCSVTFATLLVSMASAFASSTLILS